MARKPNFRFERQERERVHAEKRAARDALKEQRKAETEGTAAVPVGDPAADAGAPSAGSPAAPASASPGAAGAPAEPPTAAAIAAMKRLGTMTPEQVAILHQNAVRLASSGSPKQRAAAQELLPQLEAELQRLGEAKRQAVAARLAGAAKRSKKQ
jgi:hypothetical protein